jgi:hypothetical protein
MNRNKSFRKTIFSFAATLVLFLGLAVISSCNELDFTDPNNPNAEPASVQALVTGVEAGIRNQLNVYILATSVIGRDAYNFDPADPAWTDEVIYGPLDPGGFVTLNPWEERYRAILNCQILKQKAPSDNGVQGFANTIIAYQLLLMSNYLYDNGIKLPNVAGTLDNFTSGHVESLNAIADILDDAAGQLSSAGGSFAFSLSSGFTGFDTPATFRQFNRALRARVAVYLEDWQGALDVLPESFIDPAGNLENGVYHVYSSGLGDQLNPIFESPTASFVKFRAHKTFVEQSEAGDLRVATKILDRSGDPTFDNPFGTSELQSAFVITVATGSTSPYPMIRNEELILIRAEARLQTNDFAGAEADLNIIRAVAVLPAYTGTDASNAVDRMLNERRYSLFAEGHRWIDGRRYGKVTSNSVDTAFFPLDRTASGNRPADDSVHLQFPRPQPEVSGG